MLATEFSHGQGLGNQLWCYVTTRVLSLQLNRDFRVINPEFFKGNKLFSPDFLVRAASPNTSEDLQSLISSPPCEALETYSEVRVYDPESGLEISGIDENLFNLPPNTKLEGNLQQVRILEAYKPLIRKWLEVEKPSVDLSNTCVINFRGGEYFHHKNISLPLSYWKSAISYVKSLYPGIKFLVVTDDIALAKKFFPSFSVGEFSMEEDYRCIAHARIAILSNSSFAWFPAWLNQNLELCIAPNFWWGFKRGIWSGSGVIVKEWIYLSNRGQLIKYQENGKSESFYSVGAVLSFDHHLNLRIFFSSIALFFKLLGVRRRKSRTAVWLAIVLKKLTGQYIFDGFINKRVTLQRNKNYTSLERKISFLESRSRLSQRTSSSLVFDIVYFFNEVEILELRLETYWDYVDFFVICESNHTFTGFHKDSIFLSHSDIFSKYKSKIIHIFNEESPLSREEAQSNIYLSSDKRRRDILSRCLIDANVPVGDNQWLTEYFQKEFPLTFIDTLDDMSVILISDVDEFWNPNRYIEPRVSEILVYKQTPFVYFMNLESNEHWNNWTGTVSALASTWKNSGINPARTHRRLSRRVIFNGGWHFSFQGGAEKMLDKLKSYGHQELNTQDIREKLISNPSEIVEIRSVRPKLTINNTLSLNLLRVFKERHPNWFL